MDATAALTYVAGEVTHDQMLTLVLALFGLAFTSPFFVMLIQTRQNRQARASSDTLQASINAVHGLVDGNLTAAMSRELEASRTALEQMRLVVAMKEDAGEPVLPETRVAIVKLERQVSALAGDLLRRRLLEHDENAR